MNGQGAKSKLLPHGTALVYLGGHVMAREISKYFQRVLLETYGYPNSGGRQGAGASL